MALKASTEMLFFIGDIHGQNDKLDSLLIEADFLYEDRALSSYAHSQIVFLGDLIDNKLGNGAEHIATLQKVKALVDAGDAFCVMGNHEFNAIGWMLQKANGEYCRSHTKAGNVKQHQLFLDQVVENSEEHHYWVNWFKSLPLLLDFETVRCIHACWDQDSVDKLKPYLNADNSLKDEYWYDAFDSSHELYQLCETLLKGPEIELPEGYSFNDKNGVERRHLRVGWWKSYAETYQQIGIVQPSERKHIPDLPLPSELQGKNIEVPVVVGHYTLPPPPNTLPKPLSESVICVDYNAASKDGKLVGYFMSLDDDEDELSTRVSEENFVFCDAPDISSHIDFGTFEIMASYIDSLAHLNNEPSEVTEKLAIHVQNTLLVDWDPLYVGSCEELADEYDAYVNDAITLIQAEKPKELAAYLFIAETIIIGKDASNHVRTKCQRIAHELVCEWKSLNNVVGGK
ncbi:metallophosphoesterase [Photobacterium kagoshimensis]|uniref:metallophosphoesterase n=1 Tax=Photobacterium kagoshimensis TaxID=2910242 RepID=UPI003D0E7D15